MIAKARENVIRVVVACGLAAMLQPTVTWGDSLCVKKKLKVVGGYVHLEDALKTYSKCPSAFTEVLNTDQFKGQDGSLRVYGDGSAGALTLTSKATLNTANTQYTNVTIAQGATLIVPSGTTIRCSGSFTNKGTIEVQNYAWGGRHGSVASGILTAQGSFAHPGILPSAAGNGALGNTTTLTYGSPGPTGLYGGAGQARQIVRPGPLGGGGGGAGGFIGGAGGGTLTVLCKGAVTNQGKIEAAGATPLVNFGDGGGGGGIVILASRASVTNDSSGTVDVRGGDGGDSYAGAAAGGGGGGGLVHFIAPEVNSKGIIFETGGTAGNGDAAASNSRRFGGGAGGAGYGAGGAGGSVAVSNVSGDGTKGAEGIELETLADPTSLF
jgi:hypothetical protein